MTILNPAHLLDAIQNQGYTIKADWPRSFVAEKHLGNRVISIQGIPHYFELLQHYFFSEKDVLGFLQQVDDQLAHAGGASGRGGSSSSSRPAVSLPRPI